jgi:hypothetical protein
MIDWNSSDRHWRRMLGENQCNCRLTLSKGCPRRPSPRVVRHLRPRTAPCNPSERISRSTVQRATTIRGGRRYRSDLFLIFIRVYGRDRMQHQLAEAAAADGCDCAPGRYGSEQMSFVIADADEFDSIELRRRSQSLNAPETVWRTSRWSGRLLR